MFSRSARTFVVRRLFVPLAALGVVAGCAATRPPVAFTVPATAPCRTLVNDTPGARTLQPAFAWHQADDASVAAHAAACATVGPAVVAAFDGADPFSAPVRPTDVVIVSWNVRVGGGDLVGLIAALRAGAFTRGEPVRHFVLLVQEAFRSGDDVPDRLPEGVEVPARIAPRPLRGERVDVLAAARAAGLHVFYVPSMRNGGDPRLPAEDRGNAILSTLPLSDPAAIELPYGRQRRVAAAAAITGVDEAGRAWRVRVVSAHLDATAGPRALWLFSSGLRERQAAHLRAALDGDLPTVLGVDLNTWAGGTREPAVRVLRQAFPDSDVTVGATFRFGWVLDYVFTRLPDEWGARVVVLDDRFGSDHHPVVARLRANDDS